MTIYEKKKWKGETYIALKYLCDKAHIKTESKKWLMTNDPWQMPND